MKHTTPINWRTALEIARTFKRMGVTLAEQPEFWRPQWAALSQYGYALGYFPTRKEAARYSVSYYSARMHLIRQ